MSRFDRKRAERFAARGIGVADLPSASTAYMGDAGGKCALCDTRIVHEYLLTFARPGGAVEFFPVGSKCITDWMRAMPESVARNEAIARVRAAEATMRAQRKVLKALADAGDEDAANLMRIFFRLPTAVQESEDEDLGDIGQRVVKYQSFRSDGQRRYFARLVRQAAAAHGVEARRAPGSGRQPAQAAEPAQAEPESPTYADPETATLMAEFEALPEGFAERRGGALLDIAQRVKRDGGFASDAQQGYFAKLVKDAPLLARFMALSGEPSGPLADMGSKLLEYGSFKTDRQRGYFSRLLRDAEAEATPPPPPPPPPAQGFQGSPEAAAAIAASVEADSRAYAARTRPRPTPPPPPPGAYEDGEDDEPF